MPRGAEAHCPTKPPEVARASYDGIIHCLEREQYQLHLIVSSGNSLTDFVSRIRINDVGFHNVANFKRRFLQVKGVTPKQFRRQSDGRFGA